MAKLRNGALVMSKSEDIKNIFQKQALSLLDEKTIKPIKENLESFQNLDLCIQHSLQNGLLEKTEEHYNGEEEKSKSPSVASRLGRNKNHEQSESLTKILEKLRQQKQKNWSAGVIKASPPKSSNT